MSSKASTQSAKSQKIREDADQGLYRALDSLKEQWGHLFDISVRLPHQTGGIVLRKKIMPGNTP